MFELYGLSKSRIEDKFTSLKNDIKLVFFTQELDCPHCDDARRFFEYVASVTRKIEFEVFNFTINQEKRREYRIFTVPALAIVGKKDYEIRYYGNPMGPELSNLLDDIVYVSRGENTLSDTVTQKLQLMKKRTQLKIFYSALCPYSLPVVKLGLQLAVASDFIMLDIIDAVEFLRVSEKYHVRGIPLTIVNEEKSFYGALEDEEYVENILKLS
jgi:glutaredoxin-like protein